MTDGPAPVPPPLARHDPYAALRHRGFGWYIVSLFFSMAIASQGLGILRAAPAVGAVMMSVYLAHRGPIERAGRTTLLAVAVFAVCLIGFGLSRSFQLLTLPEMPRRVSAVVLGGAASRLVVGLSARLVPRLRRLGRLANAQDA